uniref:Uncharacterized protein n=1 Tax=Anguilla anguilla TaxID=7936 RepID=A0A0E9USR4_ANGAN
MQVKWLCPGRYCSHARLLPFCLTGGFKRYIH